MFRKKGGSSVMDNEYSIDDIKAFKLSQNSTLLHPMNIEIMAMHWYMSDTDALKTSMVNNLGIFLSLLVPREIMWIKEKNSENVSIASLSGTVAKER